MTRLIDADYLLKELEEWQEDIDDAISGRQLGVTDAIVIACQMPTVDAVPVVRCKDCKYSKDEYGDGDCYCDLSVIYIGKDWNHFCSWAERKEE